MYGLLDWIPTVCGSPDPERGPLILTSNNPGDYKASVNCILRIRELN